MECEKICPNHVPDRYSDFLKLNNKNETTQFKSGQRTQKIHFTKDRQMVHKHMKNVQCH